jgi:hypothetical protein
MGYCGRASRKDDKFQVQAVVVLWGKRTSIEVN